MANSKRVGRRAALRTVGALGVLGTTASVAGGAQAAPAATPGHELAGSWVVSGVPPAPRLLQTFTIDGCTISTDNEHPNRTPSHGAWMRVGDRQFLTRHMAFRFEPAGTVSGRIEARIVYSVAPDGQTMQGSGFRYDFDAEDNPTGPPIPIQGRGTRIVPLLPE
jgi:hypothetical protein